VSIENITKTHLQHGTVNSIQNVGLTKFILHAFQTKGLNRNLVDDKNDKWQCPKSWIQFPILHIILLYTTPNLDWGNQYQEHLKDFLQLPQTHPHLEAYHPQH
jgi:hypothetical protein